MKTLRLTHGVTSFGAAVLLPTLFYAQAVTPRPPAPASTTPVPTDSEIVALTPFEVSESKDTGYAATETLAGTRIRTNLADVGSAIQVLTKQFMNDLGATDNQTLLQFATSAEVAGTHSTYAGVGNGASVDESGNLRAPQGAQRVRGLAAADNSRDFFITEIPWDSYITDRIDIQRGPNSILFGLGSPAGLINASTHNAEFRNSGEVVARMGSYGSIRGSIDINQQIVPKQLAVRFDVLRNDERYRQKPAYQDDNRLFGAVRYDPQLFKAPGFHTSIKAKYEWGDIKANRPRTITPNDNLSAWFRPVAVTADNPFSGMNKLVANNPYDPWRTDNVVPGDGRGITQNSTGNYNAYVSVPPNAQQPYWLIDGATNQLIRVEGGWINNGARSATGTVLGAALGLPGRRTNDNFYGVNGLNGAALNLGLPNAQYGQYRQQSLLDPSIFNYNDILIDGPNKNEREKWDAYNINLQQTFWRDRLGVEFAYDRQKYRNAQNRFFGGNPTITIDIMKNFSDFYTIPGADGVSTITNPNFGRPYVTGGGNTGSGNSYHSDRKYTRASLFGEVRSSDWMGQGFLSKMLGNHRFNGVYSGEKYSTENLSWQMIANSKEWAGFWNQNDGSTSSLSDRPPQAFVYVGPSIANRTTAAGASIPGIKSVITMPDAGVHVFDSTWTNFAVPFGNNWNVPQNLWKVFNGVPNPESTAQLTQASNPDNYKGWSTFQDNLLRYNDGADPRLLNRASLSMRQTKSYAGSWQGYLWNNAIVPTLGWRYDEVKSKAINAGSVPANRNVLNLDPNVYRLPDGYPSNAIFKDHSTSGGMVAHLNRLIGDRLPINVSVQYNKSNNFQVTDARRDLYGNPIANPTGQTKDYGVVLSTKDNKYSLRIVKFDTKIQGANSGLSIGALGQTIQQGLRWRNVFLYKLGGYDFASREQPQNRNVWGGSTAQGDAVNGANTGITSAQGRALEDSAIRTWNDIQKHFSALGFFKAWGFTPTTESVLTDRTTYESNPAAYAPDPNSVSAYIATAPPGFTITSDTQSKGYELEFTANPIRNWRMSFNASKTEAFRRNVGGKQIDDYVAFLDSKFTNPDGSLTPAAIMPQFGNLASFGLFFNVYSPWRGNYIAVKANDGAAVPEIRKWRFNYVTNYTFHEGWLKNVSVGGSWQWIDKVGIGYPSVAGGLFDLKKPYYGPSESTIGLWTGYERKLNDKIGWKIQLNVRNAFAKDGLIPVSIEPDGKTWASVRVKPNREWYLTNTFSF